MGTLQPFPTSDSEPASPMPAQQPANIPQPKRRIPWLLIAGSCVVLVAIGGAAYWFTRPHAPKPAVATQQSATTPQPTSQPESTTPTNSSTATYTSRGQDLNLSFDYPSDWTVTPASGGNSDDKPIIVTSPMVSLTNSGNQAITGKIIVSIRPGTAQLTELSSGKAVIAQDSVQFAYTKPTSAQHQYPYLTYVRLNGGNDAANGFDEVFITGISKFTKGQNISSESLGQLDPIISARFYTCPTSACSTADAATLLTTASAWQNSAPFQAVQALFGSLQLR